MPMQVTDEDDELYSDELRPGAPKAKCVRAGCSHVLVRGLGGHRDDKDPSHRPVYDIEDLPCQSSTRARRS